MKKGNILGRDGTATRVESREIIGNRALSWMSSGKHCSSDSLGRIRSQRLCVPGGRSESFPHLPGGALVILITIRGPDLFPRNDKRFNYEC